MEKTATDTARVGERLRRLRESRGESMAVARLIRERFGVKLDPSYLSRMERGRAEIPLRTLFALARYYGVAPADLVHLEEFQHGGPLEDVLSQPDLKSELEELYGILGKDQLLQLLWWYFRILRSTLDTSKTA
jgi:transcriptional regulator with XRE-family HTH domain